MDANSGKHIPSDSELLYAIQTGSQEAADELCRRHDPKLQVGIATFLRRHGCEHPTDHAYGVKTDAWVSIIDNIRQLKDADKFDAWRDAIARHKAIEHLRTCIAEQNTSVELKDESLLPEAQISDYYASRDAAIDADKMLILAESISPEFAQILRLRDAKGLSFDQIAARMGQNKEKLRTAYYRGLRKLLAKVRSRGG